MAGWLVMGLLRGREPQVEALRGQLDALLAGRGGTVLVSGLAGMGKTVLLDAAGTMARELGIRVFRGGGDAAARVIPFGPLLKALVSARDAPVDPAAIRDLSQSPDQRFRLLRELQESLERAALRTPVLISIDDVQWADDATLVALVTLSRQLATHRILWLLAARTGELSLPGCAACFSGTRWPARPPTRRRPSRPGRRRTALSPRPPIRGSTQTAAHGTGHRLRRGARGTNRTGTARRAARTGRSVQSRDRHQAVHQRAHRPVPPAQGSRQARHHLAQPARPRPAADAPVVSPPCARPPASGFWPADAAGLPQVRAVYSLRL
jgi:hypothetical protein